MGYLKKVTIVVSDLFSLEDGRGSPDDAERGVVVSHGVGHAAVVAQAHRWIDGATEVAVLQQTIGNHLLGCLSRC